MVKPHGKTPWFPGKIHFLATLSGKIPEDTLAGKIKTHLLVRSYTSGKIHFLKRQASIEQSYIIKWLANPKSTIKASPSANLLRTIIIKGHALRRACLQPATNTQNSKPRPPIPNARSKGKLENKIKHCSKLSTVLPIINELIIKANSSEKHASNHR